MSLYNTFETDTKAETEGLLLEYGPNSKGKMMAIRIRRAGGANHRFAKVFEQKSKPHRRLMEIPGALDPRIQERVMREVYADSVIVGWENIEDRDGKELEFNRDNVIQLLTDLPDLFKDIIQSSQNTALFRSQQREAEAKN